MTNFITVTQLATMFGVSRAEIKTRLADLGLLSAGRVPTDKAVNSGICKVLSNGGSLVLWRGREIVIALATKQRGVEVRVV